MVRCMLCFPIPIICYMCWALVHLVCSQSKSLKFEFESGIMATGSAVATLTSGSLLECATECTKSCICCGFNYAAGHCELLSSEATCGLSKPGWVYGYHLTGK